MKKLLTFLSYSIFLCANAQDNNPSRNYDIVMGDLKVPAGRCGVSIEIDGAGKFDAIAVAPQYIVNFEFKTPENINRKIKVKGVIKWGIPPNNAPACPVNGEISINSLILDEWKPIKDRLSGTPALTCINMGVEYYGERIDGPTDYNSLYLRVKDARSSKIFETCDKIIPIQIRENVSCELNNGAGKSICNEGYYSASQTSGQRLTFNQAIVASLKGEEIKRGAWETKEAEFNRNNKVAKEEEERRRLAKERADREKWLESPEGKRHIAEEEAKRKKAEDERIKSEVAQNARIAKEFPYYAVISCGIGTGHIMITACLSGDYGSLEIRNGNDYGLYKIGQIINRMVPNATEQRDGLRVNLRNNFEINARNGGQKNMILGVKIIQRNSGNVVFQKQVDNYGSIIIKN